MKRITGIQILYFILFLIINPFGKSLSANGRMPSIGPLWVPIGFLLSDTSYMDGEYEKKHNLSFGGEASFIYYNQYDFFAIKGLYADIVRDGEGNRISVGPETSIDLDHIHDCFDDIRIIIDGGYLYQISKKIKGYTGRLLLQYGESRDISFFMPYVRYGRFFNSYRFVEFGLLVKYPLPLCIKNR